MGRTCKNFLWNLRGTSFKEDFHPASHLEILGTGLLPKRCLTLQGYQEGSRDGGMEGSGERDSHFQVAQGQGEGRSRNSQGSWAVWQIWAEPELRGLPASHGQGDLAAETGVSWGMRGPSYGFGLKDPQHKGQRCQVRQGCPIPWSPWEGSRCFAHGEIRQIEADWTLETSWGPRQINVKKCASQAPKNAALSLCRPPCTTPNSSC